MMFSIIVAVDLNNGIGKENKLLCHLPDDLKNFKRITLGKTVIMGRSTYESLPVKPLPGRENIILSKTLEKDSLPDCIIFSSVEDMIKSCDPGKENFIIGGETIYEQMLPYAEKLYITRIIHAFDADAYFPSIDLSKWKLESSVLHEADEKHLYKFYFEVYSKKDT